MSAYQNDIKAVAALKEQFGSKRILLTDDQRRRIAVKGKVLGRKQLSQIGKVFTPDSIIRWHRQLVTQKGYYSHRKQTKSGRPRVGHVIVDLTVKFAKENPTWGYDRISGALSNVGYNTLGQKTQLSDKHCKKATSKRLSGIHLSRTDVLSTAVMFLRSF